MRHNQRVRGQLPGSGWLGRPVGWGRRGHCYAVPAMAGSAQNTQTSTKREGERGNPYTDRLHVGWLVELTRTLPALHPPDCPVDVAPCQGSRGGRRLVEVHFSLCFPFFSGTNPKWFLGLVGQELGRGLRAGMPPPSSRSRSRSALALACYVPNKK